MWGHLCEVIHVCMPLPFVGSEAPCLGESEMGLWFGTMAGLGASGMLFYRSSAVYLYTLS